MVCDVVAALAPGWYEARSAVLCVVVPCCVAVGRFSVNKLWCQRWQAYIWVGAGEACRVPELQKQVTCQRQRIG